jgi:putative flippase GtrA
MELRKTFTQAARFVVVGLINTGVDFLGFNIAALLVGLDSSIHYLLCKTISFLIAMSNSFYLNRRFTFRSDKRSSAVKWRFFAVTVATFLISSTLSTFLFVFLQHTGVRPGVAGNAGVLVSAIVGMMTNFLGYKYVVFQTAAK